jgi:hypothetical protein
MLNTSLAVEERITTAHRAKLAYVYVRQSSPGQVRHHQERGQSVGCNLNNAKVERIVNIAPISRSALALSSP